VPTSRWVPLTTRSCEISKQRLLGSNATVHTTGSAPHLTALYYRCSFCPIGDACRCRHIDCCYGYPAAAPAPHRLSSCQWTEISAVSRFSSLVLAIVPTHRVGVRTRERRLHAAGRASLTSRFFCRKKATQFAFTTALPAADSAPERTAATRRLHAPRYLHLTHAGSRPISVPLPTLSPPGIGRHLSGRDLDLDSTAFPTIRLSPYMNRLSKALSYAYPLPTRGYLQYCGTCHFSRFPPQDNMRSGPSLR